ncbi:MAG: cobyrinate a,c-diamide synthase [Porphyromonas sp.]|nr:cobyrinate a,c-diamide synthase [Porphyromonas sp.]
MTTIPQLLVAATNSGCGKTTFTLGLLRLLRRRGLEVAGFKCGPDYIDPKFHQLASGRESINLDLYMMSPEHVGSTYARYSQGADAIVVEGVMGLYDGSEKMQGSPAEIAKLLDIPVVLLVNAASSAYSVGAIIYGYKHWQPGVRIVGVVFNRVASENHYSFLADAARDAGVESLGYIPRTQSLEVPSRHLGLSLEELARLDAFPDQVADLLEAHVDIARLLELCASPSPQVIEEQRPEPSAHSMRIAVARDEAFNFSYPENIRALERLGAVCYFSPLRDATLPECELLYLPGGYPEFYLDRLSANSAMRSSIRDYAEAGGRILAECGGMMYLTRAIIDEDGSSYPMCGILDNAATMQGMKLSLGYRCVRTKALELRGHEFHYSRLTEAGSEAVVAEQFGAKGNKVPTALYRYRNVLAGYTHLYWAEQDILALWE